MFYIAVERVGDKIYERYIENGKEKERWVEYSPVLFSHSEKETKWKDIYGKYCEKHSFASMGEANGWKKQMQEVGLSCLGMDNFVLSYISDTWENMEESDKKYIRIVNMDIEVTGRKFPDPALAEYEIDAITHYDSIEDKYYVFDLLKSNYGNVTAWDKKLAALPDSEGGDEVPTDILGKVVYKSYDAEKDLLNDYINLWEKQRPAIFTGWSIEGFDIPYLLTRIKHVLGERSMKRLSPIKRVNSKVISNMYGTKEIFTIAGVAILDYLDLYKKFSFTNQPSYRLDYVALYETKKGKLEYDGPINKLRETNHQRYISYNIIDVESVQAIDKVRGFIDLSISTAHYSKTNFSDVMSPVKLWDSIIFNSLKLQNKVIPENISHSKQQYPGAFVKEPKPGMYKIGASVDATSLYPSIIRQGNISPETIFGQFTLYEMHEYINGTAPKPSEEFSCSPNGWMYTKEYKGIMPIEVEKVFFQRKEWKTKMKNAEKNLEVINNILGD